MGRALFFVLGSLLVFSASPSHAELFAKRKAKRRAAIAAFRGESKGQVQAKQQRFTSFLDRARSGQLVPKTTLWQVGPRASLGVSLSGFLGLRRSTDQFGRNRWGCSVSAGAGVDLGMSAVLRFGRHTTYGKPGNKRAPLRWGEINFIESTALGIGFEDRADGRNIPCVGVAASMGGAELGGNLHLPSMPKLSTKSRELRQMERGMNLLERAGKLLESDKLGWVKRRKVRRLLRRVDRLEQKIHRSGVLPEDVEAARERENPAHD